MGLTQIQILGIVLAICYFVATFFGYWLKQRAFDAVSKEDQLNITIARPDEFKIGQTLFLLIMTLFAADLINNFSTANFSFSSIIRSIALGSVGFWTSDFFNKDEEETESVEEERAKVAEEKLPKNYRNAERIDKGLKIATLAFCFLYFLMVF